MGYEVYDQAGNRLYDYNLNLGRLEPYAYTIDHPAVETVAEQGHWESTAVYYNDDGSERGRDVMWIIDMPAVEGHDAYTETGVNYIYIPYTEEELEAAKAASEQLTPIDMMDAMMGGLTDG